MPIPTTDRIRVALLSLDEPSDETGGNRRMLGGASVLERQVDAALALGASRIWLHTLYLDHLAIRAQRLAEQAGADFRIIKHGRQLLGGMRQQDELLVLSEGWLPADEGALALFDRAPVVLTLPWKTGQQEGFERMDREHCWAGAMILPGRVLERLDELDEDMEVGSALLRAARVTRVPERPVPEEWLASGRWSLNPRAVPTAPDTDRSAERTWLERTLLHPLGRYLGERPQQAAAAGVAAAVCGVMAAGLLFVDQFAPGVLAAAGCSLLARAWIAAQGRSDPRVFSRVSKGSRFAALRYLPDGVGAVGLLLGLRTAFGWQEALYMAIATCGLWLLAGLGRHRFSRVLGDREWLWLLCGVAGLAGQWFVAIAAASLLAMAGILLNLRNPPAITRL